jgi:hypothetical protein
VKFDKENLHLLTLSNDEIWYRKSPLNDVRYRWNSKKSVEVRPNFLWVLMKLHLRVYHKNIRHFKEQVGLVKYLHCGQSSHLQSYYEESRLKSREGQVLATRKLISNLHLSDTSSKHCFIRATKEEVFFFTVWCHLLEWVGEWVNVPPCPTVHYLLLNIFLNIITSWKLGNYIYVNYLPQNIIVTVTRRYVRRKNAKWNVRSEFIFWQQTSLY